MRCRTSTLRFYWQPTWRWCTVLPYQSCSQLLHSLTLIIILWIDSWLLTTTANHQFMMISWQELPWKRWNSRQFCFFSSDTGLLATCKFSIKQSYPSLILEFHWIHNILLSPKLIKRFPCLSLDASWLSDLLRQAVVHLASERWDCLLMSMLS